MKPILFTFLLVLNVGLLAQNINPSVTFKDFGYHKQVKKVERMSYEFKDKFVADTEKEVMEFDENGNILRSTITSFLDNNAQIIITYEYQNGKLIKQRQENSRTTPHLQYTITYSYDKLGNLKSKKMQTDDGVTEEFSYQYKKGILVKSTAKYSSTTTSESLYLHSKFGELYAIKTTENVNGKMDVFNEVIHNKKKVADYDESNTGEFQSYLYSETDKAEIQYRVERKEMLEEIKEMQERLRTIKHLEPDVDMNANLSYLSNTLHYISPMNIKNFKRNELGDIIASSDVYAPFKTVENLDFYKITYVDGSVSGDENFDMFTFNELQKMLTDETK